MSATLPPEHRDGPAERPATPAEALDLDAIEAHANAATPGPWHGEHEQYDGNELPCVSIGDFGWVCAGERSPQYDIDSEQGKADAEFIAHVRADVPVLVAEVRRLRAELADLKWAEILTEQGCAEGRHTEWYADTENLHACPWCEVEALRARADELDAASAVGIHTGSYQQGWGDACELLAQKYDDTAAQASGSDTHLIGQRVAYREAARVARATDPGPAPTTGQPSEKLIRDFTERVGLLREPDEDYSNEADARALLWWLLSQLGAPAPVACCSHLSGHECDIHSAPATDPLARPVPCAGCRAIIDRWQRKAVAEGLNAAHPPVVLQGAACRECGGTPLEALLPPEWWVCPVPSHSEVELANGVASCLAPGCARSSDDPPGGRNSCECELYDCDGGCCGGQCTCATVQPEVPGPAGMQASEEGSYAQLTTAEILRRAQIAAGTWPAPPTTEETPDAH